MKWQGGRRSSNVEDRRGMGGFGRPMAVGGGVVGLVVLLLTLFFGGGEGPVVVDDGSGYGGSGYGGSSGAGPAPQRSAEENELADFISVVLADTEDTWPQLLAQEGVRYVDPHLVLFTGQVESACGFTSSAVGPFYCPPDQKVYLDLSFFQELRRLGGSGDFAMAYVVAHEVGHHVQNLLGISDQVQQASARMSKSRANALSVRTELQADCFAGVWANHAQAQRQLLEEGDVEEGLRAAASIGDDTLQKRSQGYVVPESFTHGSSAQRAQWFRRGLETGSIAACDTFNEP